MSRFLIILSIIMLACLVCACVVPDTAAELPIASEGQVAQPDLDRELERLLKEQQVGTLAAAGDQDPAKVLLGQMLYFDKELSGNRDISCATCHHPDFASGDGLSLSIGTGGIGLGPARQRGAMRPLIPRNAPEIFNRGDDQWHTMFWDGRVEGSAIEGFRSPRSTPVDLPSGLDSVLAAQAMFPVTSAAEMRGARGDVDLYGQKNELAGFSEDDLVSIWQALMKRLMAIPKYRDMFAAAYPLITPQEMGFEYVANALAAFEIDAFTLLDSPWDRYLRGEEAALSPAAKRGAILFYGDANCSQCHSGALLTDQAYHNIGIPQIGPGKGREAPFADLGRYRETSDPDQKYAIRTPPLRNVALTGPWMHNGAITSLGQAIQHHLDPITACQNYDLSQVSADVRSDTDMREPIMADMLGSLDPLISSTREMTGAEIDELTAFLEALTDPAALDLSHLVPDSVPSGLPVGDSLPDDTAFKRVTAESGISMSHEEGYQVTGQAWGDYDGDGWLDLYLTTGQGSNQLYRNRGDGSFSLSPFNSDVALENQDSAGAVFVDYDNDGWTDLYVVARGANALLRNQTGHGYTDVTEEAGVGDDHAGKTASWGDYDADGYLDLYVANWSCIPRCPRSFEGDRDVLYHNNGDGTFSDVTALLGPHTRGAGFVASFTDYDNDGDVDIYLVNDEFVARSGNKLWRNDGPGCGGWCFTEISASLGANIQVMGMGLAPDDFDGDGLVDFYFSNAGEMVLLQNLGAQGFVDIAGLAGVALDSSAIGWGAVSMDYNNDRYRDIYLALMDRGTMTSPINPLFHNNGDGTFTDLGTASGAADPGPSIGVAIADYDRDGGVDMVVGNYKRTYELYHNQAARRSSHHWLTLKLTGAGGVNTDAVGAKVYITDSDNVTQIQEVRLGSSLGSGNALELYFGLGDAIGVKVRAVWPDGSETDYGQVVVDRGYELLMDGTIKPLPRPVPSG